MTLERSFERNLLNKVTRNLIPLLLLLYILAYLDRVNIGFAALQTKYID